MHPALLRHVHPPVPRFLRNFVFGAAIGLAGLVGGLALADATSPGPSVHVVNPAGLVIMSAGADRQFGTTDDVRSDR